MVSRVRLQQWFPAALSSAQVLRQSRKAADNALFGDRDTSVLRRTCFGFLIWLAKTNDPTFPRLPIPSFAPLRPKKHNDRGKSAITAAEDLDEDIKGIAFEKMATG